LPTNSHFVGLFIAESKKSWHYIKKMLQQASYWLYIVDEHQANFVKNSLDLESTGVPQNGDIISSSEFYLREQIVRAKPVIDALEKKIGSTDPAKAKQLMIFIEMSWAVRTPSGDIYLRELQEAFQQFLVNKNLTIVCIYNETILLEEQLMLGLFSHPEIYTDNGIKANPYFLPSNIIKKNQLKPRFDYWLSKTDPSRELPVFMPNEVPDDRKNYPLEKGIHTQMAQTNEGRWKIRCFGELRIHRENGELIDWNTKAGSTRKLKTIFAFLLIKGEKGAKAEELADLLWPDADDTEQAMNRLYHAIRYLRMVLNGNNDAVRESPYIVCQSSIYYLKWPFDSWIDLPMFQELCFKGNQHFKENSIEQSKICYDAAERLYSGDLFNDIPLKYIENNDNDWCWGKRFWYREMYHKLLYSLAAIHRQLGNLSLAITYCDKALAEDPALEAAHREKLITLAESQRFDALHRQYKIYTESLKKFNLGLPSNEMRALYLSLNKLQKD
jgi:two-component SAPR family response regulator